jgi:hypothetical protein
MLQIIVYKMRCHPERSGARPARSAKSKDLYFGTPKKESSRGDNDSQRY